MGMGIENLVNPFYNPGQYCECDWFLTLLFTKNERLRVLDSSLKNHVIFTNLIFILKCRSRWFMLDRLPTRLRQMSNNLWQPGMSERLCWKTGRLQFKYENKCFVLNNIYFYRLSMSLVVSRRLPMSRIRMQNLRRHSCWRNRICMQLFINYLILNYFIQGGRYCWPKIAEFA